MYKTVEEIQQKITGTVVLYNNLPVIIKEVVVNSDQKIYLRFTSCKSGSNLNVKWVDDPLFDFKNLGSRLGYINYQFGADTPVSGYQEALYAVRTGIRKSQQTQGLSKYNVRVSALRGSPELAVPPMEVPWDSMIYYSGFEKTFKSEFPSPIESLESIRSHSSVMSCAFNRHFAIVKPKIGPMYLHYKYKPIGYLTGDKFEIHEDYEYLKESLEDIPDLKLA